MSAFENARGFLEACDSARGWAGCQRYVADGARFRCQAAALAGIETVEAYCEWAAAIGNVTAPGARYELHAAGWDEERRTALFFATYHARHTGEGGPVPPTGKETHTNYVYALTMDANDQVASMTKVWNAPWALRELGWAE